MRDSLNILITSKHFSPKIKELNLEKVNLNKRMEKKIIKNINISSAAL